MLDSARRTGTLCGWVGELEGSLGQGAASGMEEGERGLLWGLQAPCLLWDLFSE